jgi:hypothetical protein
LPGIGKYSFAKVIFIIKLPNAYSIYDKNHIGIYVKIIIFVNKNEK